jgi:putative ABC transport system permease protein
MTLAMTMRQARRALTANKVRTLLMMVGVTIGIAALTIIVSVGQGAKAQVMGRVQKMFGRNPIMVTAFARMEGMREMDISASTLTPEDAQAIAKEIANVDQVALVQSKSGVPVKYHDQSITTELFGVTPNWSYIRIWDVAEGEPLGESDQSGAARVCLLGATVARELFGDVDPVGETVRIENVNFKVKGVLVSKGANPRGGDFDDRLIIPISTFSRRLYNVTNLSQVLALLKDTSRMEQTSQEVTALMRERHQITGAKQDDFGVRTASSIVQFASGTQQTLSLFLGVVAAISLLVGGLVIMNIMLVSVSERTREIGIRRAVGARRRDILRQFLAEALAVTLAGGLFGVLIGAGGAMVLSAAKDMPTTVSWQAVAVAVAFSTIIGIVFGVQPARRAARLHPVEALRTE